MILSSQYRQAMRQVGMGADIFDLEIANRISLIEQHRPDLVETCEPMNEPKGDAPKPIIGAKLTAQGVLEAYEGIPGPWQLDDDPCFGIIKSGSKEIGFVMGIEDEIADRHTVNVMRAAPQLFEILVKCVELLDSHDAHWREDIELDGYTPEDVINGVLSDG
jgi:hypothetical protein